SAEGDRVRSVSFLAAPLWRREIFFYFLFGSSCRDRNSLRLLAVQAKRRAAWECGKKAEGSSPRVNEPSAPENEPTRDSANQMLVGRFREKSMRFRRSALHTATLVSF